MIPKMCSEDSSIDCTKVPYAIYGILTIVGCVLMFGLPETKDETSPDNIEDGEVFGKVSLFFIVSDRQAIIFWNI